MDVDIMVIEVVVGTMVIELGYHQGGRGYHGDRGGCEYHGDQGGCGYTMVIEGS